MVLLDTTILLWLSADQNRLSSLAKECIKNNAGNLFISAISAFEIAVKARKGKIVLPLESGVWFERVIKFHGIQEVPINSEIASLSVSLPLLHNDPCDRIIIATAIRNSMIIVSSDELITQYEGVKVIW
ncbi:MAG: type II toxin-antitoxin system VapC family toxin [bacterium]